MAAATLLSSMESSLNQPKWLKEEVSTGTSIMAVEFDGGVVIGADSRTSSGAYVANRVSDKLTEISDRIFCCRSGSSADTQATADQVKYYISLHTMEQGEPPLVNTAANLFRRYCYENREKRTAGILCAGWDKREGGQVYSIPLGGMYVRQPFAIGGSGSTYVYGYCDAQYKAGMSREECIAFVKNALGLAVARDGSSGGVLRLAVIDENGVERMLFTGSEIPTFYTE
ncbi:proteasome subunit beta type-6-like [Halichondria panicea]|uniref:proteasome subunit beta type-6-like n=1 Tax=Halichondria panicea TaxID=6063 RepID=UPI00312B41C0